MNRLYDWIVESTPLGLFVTRFRYKLLAGLLAVALIPLLALAVATYATTEQVLLGQATHRLESVRETKADQLEQFFATVEAQLLNFAENPTTATAVQDLDSGFTRLIADRQADAMQIGLLRAEVKELYRGPFSERYRQLNNGAAPEVLSKLQQLSDEGAVLQSEYLVHNPFSWPQRDRYSRSAVESTYNLAHGQFHPVLKSTRDRLQLQDLILVDATRGDIIYTCRKELEFATNLRTGPLALTSLSRAYLAALDSDPSRPVTMVDYSPYFPGCEQPACFLACPVMKGKERVGVAIFELSIEPVNRILTQHVGLGQSGETYAVGDDRLMRSDSRFLKSLQLPTTVLRRELPIDQFQVSEALRGMSGTRIVQNYRGEKVLSSCVPVTIHPGVAGREVKWVLLAEMSLAELQQPVVTMFWQGLTIIAIATLLVTIAAVIFSRGVTRQTDAMTEMLNLIGIGLFESRAEIVSRDELGTVAKSLNSMCDNTLSLIQSHEERQSLEQSVRKLQREVERIATGDLTTRAEAEEGLTVDIAHSINSMVAQLQEIVRNVQVATHEVSSSANDIRATAERLSAGSLAQSQQIESTSLAVGEMAESIQLVSSGTQHSAEIAEQARQTALRGSQAVQNTIRGMERIRDQVQGTSKRIKRLGETSQEVGEIVQLISDLADRTSILALNASIQAAMAGDSGQGFAVVAEEVERLAERANDATRKISGLIKSMQGETAEAMTAMEVSTREVVSGTELADEAGQALEAIDAVSRELAEEIRTISTSTRQQALKADMMARSMAQISDITAQTSTGTQEAAEAISSLSQLADSLRESVSQFKLPMRNGRIFTHDDDPTFALDRLVETALAQ